MAHIYHPDKNPNNQQTNQYFNELKEAYEILSNHQKRIDYDKEFWLTYGNKKPFEFISAKTLLDRVQNLHEVVIIHKRYSVIEDHLTDYLLSLLQDNHITIFRKSATGQQYSDFVTTILSLSSDLPKHQFAAVQERLQILTDGHSSRKIVDESSQKRKNIDLYHQYKALIILVIALIICGMMYLYISGF